MMTEAAKTAFEILRGMGARVKVENKSKWKEQFQIMSELLESGDERFVYYGDIDPLRVGDLKGKKLNELGIREDVHTVLEAHGLRIEWIDMAHVAVYHK